jgi:formamidopyrimidine-DNA glycosylase
MPELPEVQTTVNGLNAEVKGFTIIDVWSDYRSSFHAGKNNIKNPEYFKGFKRDVVGAKIVKAARQGKNILIHLSNKKTMLVHMKMTGHFMYGEYVFDEKEWKPKATEGPLVDPYNKYLHLVFTLSDKKQLVFSDLRKFGKVFLFNTEDEGTIEDLMKLGPDPLKSEFDFEAMEERLKMKPNGKIKQVLMDQTVISGIGNIYSDEMLWSAGIHPLSQAGAIPLPELQKLFKAMKETLEKGIDFGGDSDSDYRNIYGERGSFQHKHNAYRRTGKPCPKRGCGGTIQRLKVGGRSAHFCDTHQTLFKLAKKKR